jgi:hypothetical protein
MDGQKKSEHMMDRVRDLALGEIHPQDELALLAHVAECEACREAYNQAGALCSFVDRGVEKLVAGEPSPQFGVRLRARLAEEAAPSRWNLNVSEMWESATRRPLSYVAVAAPVVLFVLFAMNGLTHRHPSVPSAPLVAQIPAAVMPPSAASSNPGNDAPQRAANPERPRTKLPPRALEARVAGSRAPEFHETVSRPAPHEPEVLVPKDELRAVAQLYEATQTGRVDTEQLFVAQQHAQLPLEWKPIEITPLESPAPDSGEDSAKGPGLP